MHIDKKVILLAAAVIIIISPLKTMGSDTVPAYQLINGNYQVVVKPNDYPSYTADVNITSIDAETIKVSGIYSGFPITVWGKLRPGDSVSGIRTYDFKVNNSFFIGQITLNFKRQNEDSLLTGYGSGNYNYLGTSGTASARISGISEKGYFNLAVVIIALLFIVGVLIIIFGFRKRNLV